MRNSPFTAVYDACVLYPAPLRDFLMWLGLSGRFRARWSAQIHDEWKRNVLKNRPDLTAEQLDRTSDLMDRAIPDALVSGHEVLIGDLTLPDPETGTSSQPRWLQRRPQRSMPRCTRSQVARSYSTVRNRFSLAGWMRRAVSTKRSRSLRMASTQPATSVKRGSSR